MFRATLGVSRIRLLLAAALELFCICAAPGCARLFTGAPQLYGLWRQERHGTESPNSPYLTKSTLFIYADNSYFVSKEKYYYQGRSATDEVRGSFSIHSDTLLCYTDECDCKYRFEFKGHRMNILYLKADGECKCPSLSGEWR